MPLYDILILAAAGFIAGAVNALAGGGTIFTFSALMATGLPAVTANATSAVSVLPGQIAAAWAYRSEIRHSLRRLLPFTLVSALGGIAGGVLLLSTDESAFRALVPFLILFATLLFLLAPHIATFGEKHMRRRGSEKPGPLATGLQGAVAVYGGYFGAGMGIMMLASLSLTEGARLPPPERCEELARLHHAGTGGSGFHSLWRSGLERCPDRCDGVDRWRME